MSIKDDTPVQYLKGVGPKLGEVLHKRGITTVGDLLKWYPRAYEDRRALRNIASLEPGQIVSVTGQVLQTRSMNLGRTHRKMYEVVVGDSTGRVSCKFFRVPYKGYFERFEPHLQVRISGKVTLYRGRIEFHHPDIHPLSEEEENQDQLIPLYTDTEGLKPAKLRALIHTAIDKIVEKPEEEPLVDPLPSWLKEKYQLYNRGKALKEIHLPPNNLGSAYLEFKSPAQRRIIFDEFFQLEMLMASNKVQIQKELGFAMTKESPRSVELLNELPFELTGAQKKALQEILKDLKAPHPMHRLVQGDVGSGKTMVAMCSAVYAADNGFQSCIMAPTEILAEQHYKNSQKFLSNIGLRTALLTGSMKAKEKEQILMALQAGKVDLIIGTHALIQEGVEFSSLGLVIVDEQHRFGVEQRNKLKQKGGSPHFLVMTATPIPRTLAMTVYGDLDISIIDELPPGRQPIVTRKVFENKRDKVFDFMAEQVQKGRQAYVVYPLVEESESMDLKNAMEEFENLKNMYPDLKFGLLHGRMKAQEKDQVMLNFREQKIDVLVSTTVIEVGVDVANANMMIIEHSERFGLSQLHQLRGRVGRGEHKSYCVLILSYASSDESKLRAETMEKYSDGFKIAEVDLEMRGPGEFLGRRQSGLTGFRLANLVRDIEVLKIARQAAFETFDRDPELQQTQHESLKKLLQEAKEQVVG
ncbi:MAG: ATP-dependent DNA helicase RecG [Bdellovibrionaceae bacterium]|nr:ATP-dependent DNA helicase RecG [Pseudobdellovibrionaceae bacterium]